MRTKNNVMVIAMSVYVAVLLGAIKGCNYYWNNQNKRTESVHVVSRDTGLIGHTEYVRFKDGSEEVKIYPGIGHKAGRSVTYYNTNGDNLVDKIRIQGSAYSHNRLIDILVRETDYQTHSGEFDKADKALLEERTNAGYK